MLAFYCTILCYIVLYYIVLFYFLYYIIILLYFIIWYHVIWYDMILHYIILYYTILYYIILYYILLYYILLYYITCFFITSFFIVYFEYILFTFFNIFFTIHYTIYCIISFLPLDMIWHYIVLYDLFWYDMILYFDIILIWNMVSAKNQLWSSPRHRHGRGHGTCAFRGRTDDAGGGAVDVHPGSGLCGTRRGTGRRAEPLVALGGFPWPDMASFMVQAWWNRIRIWWGYIYIYIYIDIYIYI